MSLFRRVCRWLGFYPTGYDCLGCIECVYPDGLDNAYRPGDFVDYAKLFGLVDEPSHRYVPSKQHGYVKVLTGSKDTEQWCF